MNSLRKWLYRPKKTDTSLLAQFFFADEELNLVATELDSFDGRKDPERCTMLVNQLRVCQDKVLTVILKVMNDAIPEERANRDFRVKFPDDVLQESMAGQLWFGAECLAAGSSILNREVESASMRPLARALTKNLDSLRAILRDQSLRSCIDYSDRIKEALVIFDKLFGEFELSYVSAMVPVKTMKEYDMLQEVTILFSETVHRALELCLLTQDMIDDCDPALMFTIPRLAIVCGLLIYPDGPLNPDMEPTNMTEMFRPFQTLLHKIRELLYTLSSTELSQLEKALCSSEEPGVSAHHVASQSDTLSQIDQGFHEDGEGIVSLDPVNANILTLSPTTGSPVTPVNLHTDDCEFSQISPSSTIVDDLEGSLNKSESQDSGLHSENVSTSDTVTVDSAHIATHEPAVATVNTVDSGTETRLKQSANHVVPVQETEENGQEIGAQLGSTEVTSIQSVSDDKTIGDLQSKRDNVSSCDIPTVDRSEDNVDDDERGRITPPPVCVKDCCIEDTGSDDVPHMCREIVEEILFNATHSVSGVAGASLSGEETTDQDCDTSQKSDVVNDNTASAPGQVTRQFSWQYNVQFALPRMALSDLDADTQSSDSVSSDSTLSDGVGQAESVSDFVLETLANMNAPRATDASSLQHVRSSSRNRTNGQKLKSPQKQINQSMGVGVGLAIAGTRVPPSDVDMNIGDDDLSLTLHSQASRNATEPKVRSCQDQQDSVEKISCKTGAQDETTEDCNIDLSDAPTCEIHDKILNKSESSGVSKGAESTSVHSTHCDGSVRSNCSSNCHTTSSISCDSDSEHHCSCIGSETSSVNSGTFDEEEIMLALQAAKSARRNEARARFRSSSDLIHRLFVCIAGVADQLQTNYASDLRHILKCVFEMNTTYMSEEEILAQPVPGFTSANTQPTDSTNNENEIPQVPSNHTDDSESSEVPCNSGGSENQPSCSNHGEEAGELPSTEPLPPGQPASTTSSNVHEDGSSSTRPTRPPTSPRRIFDEPPEWVPDDEVERCTACKTPFTFVRRRHHCRNCGKIFCGKCSSTTVPLPQYGHQKPVRVCHRCFLYQVSHFTVSSDF